ncbi:alpha/beta hydrolase [Arthrobacter sp. Sa2CUA1]|uniref:Alpha/beta hydrolase n=1 Tax=Arthrobacter gallicola TaxID=2762225 RepID=A0ABR8UNQ5_9MICC|nr:alpha/beta hydrolase [Arthrobacter gallicola]MBD7994184.1 alpha/beta hydrolase [Arthrobacter gallicola]
MGQNWQPDRLGDGYRYLTLELGEDDEGPVAATLVSYTAAPPPPPSLLGRLRAALSRASAPVQPVPVHAVIYIHGWTDYFFQTELAAFWTERGVAFYALDLRKYGRSLRPGQSEGFITDLADYDADIEAALAAAAADVRSSRGEDTPVRISLMAHSTGGLVASLWAHRNPGRIEALILNSPWLELRGSSLARNAAAGILEPLARTRPKTRLKIPELDFYWRSVSAEADGEWELHPEWKPRGSWPIRAGWVTAVLAGHAQVARGLDITAPILLMASARSTIGATWNESMMTSDSVLDVNLMVQRGLLLGPCVTVLRFDGALHDILLSAKPVRRRVYAQLDRWCSAYLLR